MISNLASKKVIFLKKCIIDDKYPFTHEGSGHSRSFDLMHKLSQLSAHITYFETDGSAHLSYLNRQSESKTEVINTIELDFATFSYQDMIGMTQ